MSELLGGVFEHKNWYRIFLLLQNDLHTGDFTLHQHAATAGAGTKRTLPVQKQSEGTMVKGEI